jgi:hypothetical protein
MKLHPNHAGVQQQATGSLKVLANNNGELFLKHLVHSPESHLLFFHTAANKQRIEKLGFKL